MSVLENALRPAAADPLREIAPWERVLVIAPHPDDETLAAGGLLQRAVAAGAAIRVIFATDGENNPWPQRVIERRWRVGAAERVRWGALRRAEAVAALATLGVPPASTRFLGFPDQGLTPLLLRGETGPGVAFAAEIRTWRPTLLIAPSLQDLHPDHNALAVLVELALDRTAPDLRPSVDLRYVVHGPNAADGGIALRLSPVERARKRAAIRCHASQLVFHRRLVERARSEHFMVAGELDTQDAPHPVCRSAVREGTLQLELAIPSWRNPFVPTRLYVLGEHPETGPLCFATTFPLRSGSIDTPLGALARAERLFVKLDRRGVFFDTAGWREVAPARDRAVAGRGALRPVRPARGRPATGFDAPCTDVSATVKPNLRQDSGCARGSARVPGW